MAEFNNKIPFILKEIQNWVTTKISDAKTIIEEWCDGRFSLNTHNHDTKYDSKGSASAVQTNLNTHDNNTTKHITSSERTAWNSKANASHTHTQSQISGLTSALAGKASTSHTHNLSSLGAVGFPDYNKSFLIEGKTFTAPSNGWINICPEGRGYWSFIDDICVAYAANDCGGDAFFIPITEGSVFKMSNNSEGTDLRDIKDRTRHNIRRFIPCK